MSKRCELTGKRFGTGNNMVVNRRKVSKRTKRRFNLNLINKKFKSALLGTLTLRISTNTYRTIQKDKYGSLENFLVKTKRANLSPQAKKLRKKIYNKVC